MSSKTVRLLEQGQSRTPALKTVDRLAAALNLETSSLFTRATTLRRDCPDTIEQVLALNLVEQRNRLGWSQLMLSESSGVGRVHIARIERGEQNPSVDTVGRLAAALDISVELLLSRPN